MAFSLFVCLVFILNKNFNAMSEHCVFLSHNTSATLLYSEQNSTVLSALIGCVPVDLAVKNIFSIL